MIKGGPSVECGTFYSNLKSHLMIRLAIFLAIVHASFVRVNIFISILIRRYGILNFAIDKFCVLMTINVLWVPIRAQNTDGISVGGCRPVTRLMLG